MIDLAKLSKQTEDKVKLAKKFIEDKYQTLLRKQIEQQQSWNKVVTMMTQSKICPKDQIKLKTRLKTEQQIKSRLQRQKDSLGNYELYQIIGKGAFGDVRIAKDKRSGKIVAIKRMKKQTLMNKKQISSAYLEREFMIKNSSSQYLVNLYSTFQDSKHVYIVMEYVPGGDLLHLLIEKDIFTEQETKFYIAEIIVAIEEIHRSNYIHRDIKPDNILINSDGHVKISDFGLSKQLPKNLHKSPRSTNKSINFNQRSSKNVGKKTTKSIKSFNLQQRLQNLEKFQERNIRKFSKVGTPDYISPEVLISETYDQAVDIWSVGVIMFECLFGYPPFSDDDSKEVCNKVINWVEHLYFPEDSDVSLEAKLLILGMVNDREKRLSISEIKQHPFFEGLNWNKLLSYKPPMIPTLDNPLDTRNFEKYDEQQEDCWGTVSDSNQQVQCQLEHGTTTDEGTSSKERRRSKSSEFLFAGFEYKKVEYDVLKQVENQIKRMRQSHKQLPNEQQFQLRKRPSTKIKRVRTEENQQSLISKEHKRNDPFEEKHLRDPKALKRNSSKMLKVGSDCEPKNGLKKINSKKFKVQGIGCTKA